MQAKKTSKPIIQLSLPQRQELRKAFDLFDTTGSGRIPIEDLRVALRALGFEPRNDEIDRLVLSLPSYSNRKDDQFRDTIDFNDFIHIMTSKMGEKDPKSEVKKSFRLFYELKGSKADGAQNEYGNRLQPSNIQGSGYYGNRVKSQSGSLSGITIQDLERVALELGEDLSKDELMEILREGDKDMDGKISEEEFFTMMTKMGLLDLKM